MSATGKQQNTLTVSYIIIEFYWWFSSADSRCCTSSRLHNHG